MDKKNIKKALTGLTLAGLVAGSTIIAGCSHWRGSCGKSSCSDKKMEKGKSSCSHSSCSAMKNENGKAKSSCTGGSK